MTPRTETLRTIDFFPKNLCPRSYGVTFQMILHAYLPCACVCESRIAHSPSENAGELGDFFDARDAPRRRGPGSGTRIENVNAQVCRSFAYVIVSRLSAVDRVVSIGVDTVRSLRLLIPGGGSPEASAVVWKNETFSFLLGGSPSCASR